MKVAAQIADTSSVATAASVGKSMPAVAILQQKTKEHDEEAPLQKKAVPASHPLVKFNVPYVNSPFTDQRQNTPFVLQTKAATQSLDSISRFTPMRQKANNTGLPENLKSGVENLSGFSMDDVKVHYNSDKPAQLKAFAYAQGSNIHISPGQEKHLPHEAWHVVQQKQGRVQPTIQKKGVSINDRNDLEQEADRFGDVASQPDIFSQKSPILRKAAVNIDILQPVWIPINPGSYLYDWHTAENGVRWHIDMEPAEPLLYFTLTNDSLENPDSYLSQHASIINGKEEKRTIGEWLTHRDQWVARHEPRQEGFKFTRELLEHKLRDALNNLEETDPGKKGKLDMANTAYLVKEFKRHVNLRCREFAVYIQDYLQSQAISFTPLTFKNKYKQTGADIMGIIHLNEQDKTTDQPHQYDNVYVGGVVHHATLIKFKAADDTRGERKDNPEPGMFVYDNHHPGGLEIGAYLAGLIFDNLAPVEGDEVFEFIDSQVLFENGDIDVFSLNPADYEKMTTTSVKKVKTAKAGKKDSEKSKGPSAFAKFKASAAAKNKHDDLD